MQRLRLLVLLLLTAISIHAQQVFQTIVTQRPVAVGESFQVQYVLEDEGKEHEFFAPDFKGFRFVSGPNIYTGSAFGFNGSRKLKNIVYTLEAVQTGNFIIPGASVRIENQLLRSRNVSLKVVSRAEAMQKRKMPGQTINEDTYLAPGEDPSAKTKRNLFIKVLVDKRSCFVGEPVTAVFKLYSRLDSKSDIVKNPGFYGFTVQDMINLDNKQTTTETINGKNFDVHIVRKVQLYPLQAGLFNVDAMEVRNQVRYSKSAVDHKPEQEIIEGVVPDQASASDFNSVVYENTMATTPVAITVNPLPQKNKPIDYMGATGNFKIQASLLKNEYAKNEEGELVVTVSGKGNFPQLSAPPIEWPSGIEGFEPTVKDELDPNYSPLQGKREFHFRFVSAKPGRYVLPEIKFSFFNPDTNNYKTVAAAPTGLTIRDKESPGTNPASPVSTRVVVKSFAKWWIFLVLALMIPLVIYLAQKKRKIKIAEPLPVVEEKKPAEYLHAAQVLSGGDEKMFYKALRNGIWDFFAEQLHLTGSGMNKNQLSRLLSENQVSTKDADTLMDILDRCETGLFTSVEYSADKTALLEQATSVLANIRSVLKSRG
jgi:hypothetical protein